MNILEPCLPACSEAYTLSREGREAGVGSAVEWEGDSWACVWVKNSYYPRRGRILAPLPGEEMGRVRTSGGYFSFAS